MFQKKILGDERLGPARLETEVPLGFGAENTIPPLFFKGLTHLVDFLARAYGHSGFGRRFRQEQL
jgi:hypothetical protein